MMNESIKARITVMIPLIAFALALLLSGLCFWAISDIQTTPTSNSNGTSVHSYHDFAFYDQLTIPINTQDISDEIVGFYSLQVMALAEYSKLVEAESNRRFTAQALELSRTQTILIFGVVMFLIIGSALIAFFLLSTEHVEAIKISGRGFHLSFKGQSIGILLLIIVFAYFLVFLDRVYTVSVLNPDQLIKDAELKAYKEHFGELVPATTADRD